MSYGAPLPPRQVGNVASVGNFTASGSIGATSLVTDVRAIKVAQTTTGVTLTLPNPSDTSVVVGLEVINTGTATFILYGQSVLPGSMQRCSWTGSAWVVRVSVDPPAYTVANLPTTGNVVGQLAFATNGRALNTSASLVNIAFEAAGSGTGVLVSWNGTAWKVVATNSTVAA